MAMMTNSEYEFSRMREQYDCQMQMMAQKGGLMGALGMGAAAGAGYHGMSAQQAAAAPPPKPDPQTNPVLLLTGDDQ